MTHGGSGVSRNSRAQPPATISIRGLDTGPRLTPNSLSAKTRPLSAVVDRLDVEIEHDGDEDEEGDEPEVSIVPPSPMSPATMSPTSGARYYLGLKTNLIKHYDWLLLQVM